MLQGAAFRILACFYDSDTYTFVELCKRSDYPTDLGGYYIRQLVKGGYLERADRGLYRILSEGKRQLAFYYGKRMLAPRPRVSILLVAQRGSAFVVLRRKVQPFIGIAEWPAGMVHMGEALPIAAARVAKERLGVDTEPHMVGIFRRIDTYRDSLFDDKFFAVHTCVLGETEAVNTGSVTGQNILCTADELSTLTNPSKALLDIHAYSSSGQGSYIEKEYRLSAADLSLPQEKEEHL